MNSSLWENNYANKNKKQNIKIEPPSTLLNFITWNKTRNNTIGMTAAPLRVIGVRLGVYGAAELNGF